MHPCMPLRDLHVPRDSQPARECDLAYSLDPGNSLIRSCTFTFSELGNHERAMDFLRIEQGSEWSNRNTLRVLLGEGKLAEARDLGRRLPPDMHPTKFYQACLARTSFTQPPSSELSQAAREIEPQMLANPDPENRYLSATFMAVCGQTEAAQRLLKSVIRGSTARIPLCRRIRCCHRSAPRPSILSCSPPPSGARTTSWRRGTNSPTEAGLKLKRLAFP